MTSTESPQASPDLIEELRGVREAVEELYLLLDHMWRNRDELHAVLKTLGRSWSVSPRVHVGPIIAKLLS